MLKTTLSVSFTFTQCSNRFCDPAGTRTQNLLIKIAVKPKHHDDSYTFASSIINTKGARFADNKVALKDNFSYRKVGVV
jgi:hypothetical protein